MTKQQQVILRLVQTSCAHCSADEIYRAAKSEMPGIGLATVYRNLNQLSEEGKIRKIETVGETDRFDKTLNQHEHAVCRMCGSMRDINVENIAEEIKKGLEGMEFTYELSVHELCKECRAKIEKQQAEIGA
ncbi:MAG: transcriptional repressor [Clostridia bacterium]|nr:transcriptional repressor [Clostridia bacterium]